MTKTPLESLRQRISAARGEAPEAGGEPSMNLSGISIASRLALELLAGAAVGAGAGFLLDMAFGSAPWLLIVCFLLGCAGGFVNLTRAAVRLDSPAPPAGPDSANEKSAHALDKPSQSGTTPP